jgi:acetylornithine/succinyldiaminopimelate/putrescine aminotransferase
VQSGCGRTGNWFAYQDSGVVPDVMTLAKSLCGGIAGGALLTIPEIAPSLRPGMHAATFGGNPIAARAGIAAIEMIEQENLLDNVATISAIFHRRLTAIAEQCEHVVDVRIRGVMIGIELSMPCSSLVQAAIDRKLLVNCTQGTVIRLLPAMNLTPDQAEESCDILAELIEQQAPRGNSGG